MAKKAEPIDEYEIDIHSGPEDFGGGTLVFDDMKFDDTDFFLIALLKDMVVAPEFCWANPNNTEYGGCYRVRDYQVKFNRVSDHYAGFSCARSVGKTEREMIFSFTHFFRRSGENLLITAPELLHLHPLAKAIEDRIDRCRLTRECLRRDKAGMTGFSHNPFGVEYSDGTRLIGRIPNRDGRGVKGQHQRDLIVEEAQDYPDAGWTEIQETVEKEGDFRYHFYGVHRGARGGGFAKRVQGGMFKIHTLTALQRHSWGPEEKRSAIDAYGGTNSPDYRRNILGEAGAASSPIFVVARLMACFHPNTLVSTPGGRVPISDVSAGDIVHNAAGVGTVVSTRAVSHSKIIKVTLESGENLFCSPEHPFLTGSGWCHADCLWEGADLVDHEESLRALRGNSDNQADKVLFEVLRGEMDGIDEWSRNNAPRKNRAHLLSVLKNIFQIRSGKVLFHSLLVGAQIERRSKITASASNYVSSVWKKLYSKKTYTEAVWIPVFVAGEWCQKLFSTRSKHNGVSHGKDYHCRSSCGTVQSLERSWRKRLRMVRGVFYGSAGSNRRGSEDVHRHSNAVKDDRNRGGRKRPFIQATTAKGHASGRVAFKHRVASIEILEPGSQGWDELCGDRDSIPLYDLTVSGHPSFVVGESGLVVHNCVDQDSESKYNTETYAEQHFRWEDFAQSGLRLEHALDLPSVLKTNKILVGMDLGLTNSPTVCSIFAEIPYKAKGESAARPRLALIRRITLQHFKSRDIRHLAYLVWKWRQDVQGIGMDTTGLGFPIFQEIEDDESYPEGFRNSVKGWKFNEKIDVGIESEREERDPRDPFFFQPQEERESVSMTVIEATTNYLREWVDANYLLLPMDNEVVEDLLAENIQRIQDVSRLTGSKKPNRFHILDSFRMATLVEKIAEGQHLEEWTSGPVLDQMLDQGFM